MAQIPTLRLRRLVLVLVASTVLMPAPAWADGGWSLSGGRFARNDWQDFFIRPGAITYEDANLVILARSWEIARPFRRLSIEVEGQVGKYFGDQDHWELNAVVAGRFHLTRPGGPVRASLAYGLGPSWASTEPPLERKLNDAGETEQLLAYWYLEGELGLRSLGDWTLFTRLHHRSGVFGLLADEGGSNVPTVGVRWHF